METTALKTRKQETESTVYRDVWTRQLSDQTWSRLQLDLDRLIQMPADLRVEISSLTPILGKEWLQTGVTHSRLTLQLLSRLMSAFVASPAFSTLCSRFGFPQEDGLGKLGIPVCFPLMAYWASRELPWLHRKLFQGQLKHNFWYFKRCSVQDFFQYAPIFVLYRLTNVLATKETANWVLGIISGKNLRRVPGLPFPLTRMMAHFTINAPHYMNFREALFYGRILGLGGSVALHDRLRTYYTRYYQLHENNTARLLSFLVRHQEQLDLDELPLLLGYVRHRFFDWRAYGETELEDYSLTRMRREMQVWHQETQANPYHNYRYQDVSWPGTHYQGFSRKIANVQYRILELTTYRELCEEGKVLSHCVAVYVQECANQRCSIWSLRASKGQEEKEESLVTIELSANGNINQALGKFNAQPEPEEMALIRDWAAQEGLRFRPT